METPIIKLRGHHLLCVHGYSGWGYSDEFKKTISQIADTLKENPDTKILLNRWCG